MKAVASHCLVQPSTLFPIHTLLALAALPPIFTTPHSSTAYPPHSARFRRTASALPTISSLLHSGPAAWHPPLLSSRSALLVSMLQAWRFRARDPHFPPHSQFICTTLCCYISSIFSFFFISSNRLYNCIAQLHRSEEFRGFLVPQNTGRAAPSPLLDFVEVAKLFPEVPRGPSVSKTVCHHSQLAATEFFENGLHFACDLVLIHWNEAGVVWTPHNQGLPEPIHPHHVWSVEDHRVVECVSLAGGAIFLGGGTPCWDGHACNVDDQRKE